MSMSWWVVLGTVYVGQGIFLWWFKCATEPDKPIVWWHAPGLIFGWFPALLLTVVLGVCGYFREAT